MRQPAILPAPISRDGYFAREHRVMPSRDAFDPRV